MRLPSSKPRRQREPIGPLIDIVFLLLVFFLLAGTIEPLRPIEIDAPESQHADAPGNDRLRILLDAKGRIGFEGQLLDLDTLAATIAPRLDTDSHRAVQIEADADAAAGLVLVLLKRLRSLGAKELALLAHPRSTTTSGDD